jgi:hypothetical protein
MGSVSHLALPSATHATALKWPVIQPFEGDTSLLPPRGVGGRIMEDEGAL